MSNISVEEVYLKDLVKQAILELVQERRDELQDVFVEALEDLALARAIEEGESTGVVSKVEVLQILEGTA